MTTASSPGHPRAHLVGRDSGCHLHTIESVLDPDPDVVGAFLHRRPGEGTVEAVVAHHRESWCRRSCSDSARGPRPGIDRRRRTGRPESARSSRPSPSRRSAPPRAGGKARSAATRPCSRWAARWPPARTGMRPRRPATSRGYGRSLSSCAPPFRGCTGALTSINGNRPRIWSPVVRFSFDGKQRAHKSCCTRVIRSLRSKERSVRTAEKRIGPDVIARSDGPAREVERRRQGGGRGPLPPRPPGAPPHRAPVRRALAAWPDPPDHRGGRTKRMSGWLPSEGRAGRTALTSSPSPRRRCATS